MRLSVSSCTLSACSKPWEDEEEEEDEDGRGWESSRGKRESARVQLYPSIFQLERITDHSEVLEESNEEEGAKTLNHKTCTKARSCSSLGFERLLSTFNM